MDRRIERSRRERTNAFTIAMVMGLLAFSIVTTMAPTARAQTNHLIQMVDYSFSPKFLTINSGDTVQWHNAGAVAHTATSNTSAWSEVVLNPGATSSAITLTIPANYTYICSFHINLGMWGAIVVSGTGIPEFPGSAAIAVAMLALVLGIMMVRNLSKKVA